MKRILAILSIVIIVVGGLGGYFFYMHTQKINDLENSLSEANETIVDLQDDLDSARDELARKQTLWMELKSTQKDLDEAKILIEEYEALVPTRIVSYWKRNEVTLDGAISSPDEWSDSESTIVTLTEEDGGSISATFWFKNDETWLYQLVTFEWNDPDMPADSVSIFQFWEGGSDVGGSWGWDAYGWDGTQWYDDSLGGGWNSVEGSGTHNGTHYFFEYRKALNSNDGCDWSLSHGQTYYEGFAVGFWDNSTSTWYDREFILTISSPP